MACTCKIVFLVFAAANVAAVAQTSKPAKYKVVENPSPARVTKAEFRVAQGKGDTTVTIFAGEKPTGGYTVKVSGVDRQGGTCMVRYQIEPPPRDAMVTQALTYPSLSIRITPACKDVKVDPALPSLPKE